MVKRPHGQVVYSLDQFNSGRVDAGTWSHLSQNGFLMAAEQTFRHVIALPLVNDIHQTLIAFLSTSDLGTWRVNPCLASTPFVLHFMRGNWKRAWFGFSETLTPGLCDVDSRGVNVPESRPMKLAITVRPSPDQIRLSLLFSVFSLASYDKDSAQQYVAYWSDRVAREVKDLSDYLRDCYDLPEPPRCGQE